MLRTIQRTMIDIRDKPLGRSLVVLAAAALTLIALTYTIGNVGAYAHLGCQYDPDSINPIQYRFFSVHDDYEDAFKQAEQDWDATSAAGYFSEYSNSVDPEINVVDGEFDGGWWAQVIELANCNNGEWDSNEVEVQFDTEEMYALTANEKHIVAEHELGHAYGLAHVYSGCRVMVQGSSKFSCTNLPSTDDANGVNALY